MSRPAGQRVFARCARELVCEARANDPATRAPRRVGWDLTLLRSHWTDFDPCAHQLLRRRDIHVSGVRNRIGLRVDAFPELVLLVLGFKWLGPGAGEPVVLLHGALSGADAWLAQAPALVEAGFSVWTPERRGHGPTADTAGPFSYAAMAGETVAFRETVVGRRAHLEGWSDGAVVGALVAMGRPELVDRLVLIGQHYNPSGQVPGGLAAQMIPLGPSTKFERLAEAINVAFGRWDFSHLHAFELADGRRVGVEDIDFEQRGWIAITRRRSARC